MGASMAAAVVDGVLSVHAVSVAVSKMIRDKPVAATSAAASTAVGAIGS
jgi:hypothetical protein